MLYVKLSIKTQSTSQQSTGEPNRSQPLFIFLLYVDPLFCSVLIQVITKFLIEIYNIMVCGNELERKGKEMQPSKPSDKMPLSSHQVQRACRDPPSFLDYKQHKGKECALGLQDSVNVTLQKNRISSFDCTSCLVYLARLTHNHFLIKAIKDNIQLNYQVLNILILISLS